VSSFIFVAPPAPPPPKIVHRCLTHDYWGLTLTVVW
jgi:hypothetical protein